MKKVIWTFGVLALTCGMASAQEVNELVPTPLPYYGSGAQASSALEKALIANEHKVNEAVAKGDKAAFAALVSADGAAVDGTGFMKNSDFLGMFDQVKVKTWKISDEKVLSIDPNTAVVTYKWVGSGTFQGQPFPTDVFASTVWTKKGDKWLAVFHQESEAAKTAPKPAAKK